MNKRVTIACMMLAMSAYCALVHAQVPLPNDVTVTAPGAEVRRNLAAFSGRWTGKWSGVLDSVFIVESIDNEHAEIIYAWGDAPQWNTQKGYWKTVAKVLPGEAATLEFSGNPNVFTVVMSSDLSTIRMTRVAPLGTNVETFKRTDPQPAIR
jgi:hypothetical protein